MNGYEELQKILSTFKKDIDKLKRNLNFSKLIFPSDGVLVVPVVATDPTSPQNGEIWYNSTSNTFKCCQNSIVKTFTTT